MDGLIAYALAKKYADEVGQSILDAGFKVQVEQDRSILNQTGEQMTLYLLPKESSLSSDTYDEYIYTNKWEQVGSTDIELDYNDLDNKPQINGHTLSGNKSTSQLAIDYTQLVNPPVIYLHDVATSTNMSFNLKKLFFNSRDFRLGYVYSSSGQNPEVVIDNKFFAITASQNYPFNFNRIFNSEYRAGMHLFKGAAQTTNFPTALNEIDRTQDYCVIHYFDGSNPGTQGKWFLRRVAGKTTNGEYVEYAQMVKVEYSGGLITPNFVDVTDQTPWQKVSGGSQIVSGVVNQNGTITFTDSDSNTFTTTGASVIGPQGDDYVLTNQDKTDIANIVLQLLPNADTMLFPEVSEVNNG